MQKPKDIRCSPYHIPSSPIPEKSLYIQIMGLYIWVFFGGTNTACGTEMVDAAHQPQAQNDKICDTDQNEQDTHIPCPLFTFIVTYES